ncbi:hypothetical protein H4219_005020 [Mycoemilia scoparia]|uniref:Pentacotripeptide-repeat region of PRORP domain-containing protein n=1 Tax=Mycoemilia scoparia TaxID=417184 RepID=A0A9W8DQU6_9FUNG|nr:hypothetical protein H4219_005020 [Mycoemilia scoparia]
MSQMLYLPFRQTKNTLRFTTTAKTRALLASFPRIQTAGFKTTQSPYGITNSLRKFIFKNIVTTNTDSSNSITENTDKTKKAQKSFRIGSEWKPLLNPNTIKKGTENARFSEALKAKDVEEAWWIFISDPSKAIPTTTITTTAAAVNTTKSSKEKAIAAVADQKKIWVEFLRLVLNSHEGANNLNPSSSHAVSESLEFSYRVVRIVGEYLKSVRSSSKEGLSLFSSPSPSKSPISLGLATDEYNQIYKVLGFAASQPTMASAGISLDPSSSQPHVSLAGLACLLARHMNADNVHPTASTLNTMLNVCLGLDDLSTAKTILWFITGNYHGLDKTNNDADQPVPDDSAEYLSPPARSWVMPNIETLHLLLQIVSQAEPPSHTHSTRTSSINEDIENIEGDEGWLLNPTLPPPPPKADIKLIQQWRASLAGSVYKSITLADRSNFTSNAENISPDTGSRQQSIFATMFDLSLKAKLYEDALNYYEAFLASNPEKLTWLWHTILDTSFKSNELWLVDRIFKDAISYKVKPNRHAMSNWLYLTLDDLAQQDSSKIASGNIVETIKSLLKGLPNMEPPNSSDPSGTMFLISRSLLVLASRISKEKHAAKPHLQWADTDPELVIAFAKQTFDLVVDRWTGTRIDGIVFDLCRADCPRLAQSLVEKAYEEQKIMITARTFTTIMSCYNSKGMYLEAVEVFRWLTNKLRDEEAQLALDSSNNSGGTGATSLLPQPNERIYTCVMKSYIKAGSYDEALSVGAMMRQQHDEDPESMKLDVVFYQTMMTAYLKNKDIAEALYLFEEMRASNVQASAHLYGTMIDGFGKYSNDAGTGLIRAIAYVDNLLPKEFDTGFYNILMEAYSRTGEPTLAFQTWELMKYRGIQPDNVTASVLIDTCGWSQKMDWSDERTSTTEAEEYESEAVGNSNDNEAQSSPTTSASKDKDANANEPAQTTDHLNIPDEPPSYRFIYRLGSILKDFDKCGLKLNIHNYSSLIECLIRSGSASDAIALLINDVHTRDDLRIYPKLLFVARGMLVARRQTGPLERLDKFVKENYPEWFDLVKQKSMKK